MTSGNDELNLMTVEGIAKDDSKPSSHDPSISLEKGEVYEQEHEISPEEEVSALSHEYPFPILADEEPELQQFTFRAVFVGCLLGAVISASK